MNVDQIFSTLERDCGKQSLSVMINIKQQSHIRENERDADQRNAAWSGGSRRGKCI